MKQNRFSVSSPVTATSPPVSGVDQVAIWLSRLLHPFVLPLPTLIIAAWRTGSSPASAIGWSLLAVPITIAPLTVYILWQMTKGRYQDFGISLRKRRFDAYLVVLVGYMLLLLLYWGMDAPQVMQASLLAALLVASCFLVINQTITKISIHAGISAGCLMVLYFMWPMLALWAMPFVLALGWARLHLKKHTVIQIILAWFVAPACVWLIFTRLF